MLALRMQRVGRSGHAQYRLIVQDSRFSPKSGRVVAYLGSYNPHTKAAILNKEKAETYIKNGAQPSDSFARLLKKEGVKLPKWVELDKPQKKSIKNPEKLKRNRPKDAKPPETPAEDEVQPAVEATSAQESTQPEAAESAEPKETDAPKTENEEPQPGKEAEPSKSEIEDAESTEGAQEKPSEPEAPKKTAEKSEETTEQKT